MKSKRDRLIVKKSSIFCMSDIFLYNFLYLNQKIEICFRFCACAINKHSILHMQFLTTKQKHWTVACKKKRLSKRWPLIKRQCLSSFLQLLYVSETKHDYYSLKAASFTSPTIPNTLCIDIKNVYLRLVECSETLLLELLWIAWNRRPKLKIWQC
mgnify:CR=1 FL=1